MKQLSFSIIFILFFACQNKKDDKIEQVPITNIGDKVLDSMATDLLLNQNFDERKCSCSDRATENKPNKVFILKNGLKYSICGYENTEEDGIPNSFSEFTIFDCKKDTILYEWDATQSCYVGFSNDTIFVDELYPIPNDINKEVKYLPFYLSKLFYHNNKLNKVSVYRKDLKKYTLSEIDQVIKSFNKNYEKSKESNSEEFLKIVNQLFWAYYSGSKKAEEIMDKLCKVNYGDGGVSEEYGELIGTYEHYKIHSDR